MGGWGESQNPLQILGKFKLNCGNYFLVSCILALLNYHHCSHFNPTTFSVLLTCFILVHK